MNLMEGKTVMKNDSFDFNIKFDGQVHAVDANTMITSLVSVSALLQESSAYLKPDAKVDLKIEAPQKGSFILLLNIVAEVAENLFDKDNLNHAATLVGFVADVFAIKLALAKNGDPVSIEKNKSDKGDLVQFKHKNGSVTYHKSVVNNFYFGSQSAQDNVSRTFQAIQEEGGIDSFEITRRNGEQLFEAEKEWFEKLSEPTTAKPTESRTITDDNAELFVFKVVFHNRYKWEFYYQGNKITASLEDQDFFQKVINGQIPFRNGDSLVVKLEIEKIFDETVNTFVNHRYRILNVNEHKPRLQQSSLID